MQQHAQPPGPPVAGKYRIIRMLDSGGMGSVYEVTAAGGARLAMKLMDPGLSHNPRFRARFDQEIRIGAALNNPHVVKVIDHGIDQRCGPYLVMELLQGENLDSLIERDGRLPMRDARRILTELCVAVTSLHAAGIIHRDLKPGNVFLTAPSAAVKVLDFGISKVVGDAPATNSTVLGTPAWMAPEQFNTTEPIGPATDVWAIGLLAFYMLTGGQFWRSAPTEWGDLSVEICAQPLPQASVRAAELGAAGALPNRFDSWFERCVSRDLRLRFADVKTAYDALEPLMKIKLVNPTPSPGPVAVAPHPASVALDLDPDEQEIQGAVNALQHRLEVTLQGIRTSAPPIPRPPIASLPPTDPQGPIGTPKPRPSRVHRRVTVTPALPPDSDAFIRGIRPDRAVLRGVVLLVVAFCVLLIVMALATARATVPGHVDAPTPSMPPSVPSHGGS
jgi:serine/threonine protein kinase